MRWARPEIKTAKAMANKVLLMILDGWGKGDHGHDDVVFSAHPEYIDSLEATYPSAQLRTDGENVGLPEGQMGNSEVGHLNIGAGRVVYQDLVKINRACRDDSILKNPEIVKAFSYAKENGKQVHFMGLVSDGGVRWTISLSFATYRSITAWIRLSCIASWTDAIPIRAAARVLSKRCRAI